MALVTLSPYNASALVLRQVSCSRRHIVTSRETRTPRQLERPPRLHGPQVDQSNAGTTAGARRTVLRPPRRPSWRFAARVTVAMLQAGMLFQFGFNCCLVRYLLAALLERDGFVLVLRSRESFCVSLLLPHTCCVCRVRVHPGHRAGRICTCSTLQWSKHILGRPGSAPHGARGERNRGTT